MGFANPERRSMDLLRGIYHYVMWGRSVEELLQ